jgi:hypothetical protein
VGDVPEPVAVASDDYEARLQVGRWLKGPLLSAVVVVRNMVLGVASAGLSDVEAVAPAWVVVTRRSDGRVVGKFAAGRDAGSGENELAAMQQYLETYSPDDFVRRFQLREG